MIALKPGDLFLESGLSLAAAAITELYRQRGFAAATVNTPPWRPIRDSRTKGRSGRRSPCRRARAPWSGPCGSPATRR